MVHFRQDPTRRTEDEHRSQEETDSKPLISLGGLPWMQVARCRTNILEN